MPFGRLGKGLDALRWYVKKRESIRFGGGIDSINTCNKTDLLGLIGREIE